MIFELLEQKISTGPKTIVLTDRSSPSSLRRMLTKETPRMMSLVRGLWKSEREALTTDHAEWTLRTGSLPQALVDEWQQLAREWSGTKAEPALMTQIGAAGDQMARRINEARKQDFNFITASAAILSWLAEQGGKLIRELSAAQAADINALLHNQVFTGVTSPQLLAKMLKPHIGLLRREQLAVIRYRTELAATGLSAEKIETQVAKYAEFLLNVRAERIARTELANAYVHGQWESIREARETGFVEGEVEKIWMTAIDDRSCPECEAMDGETVGHDELFSCGLQHPPLHVNCLLGETPVLAPGIISGFVAQYNGPVIRIVFSGGDITVTPNHMFLTPEGFARASSLRKGDKIFYSLLFEREMFSHPNNDRKPASIEQVVAALSKYGRMSTRSVPISAKYFHGEGAFMDGNVDIITSDGFLRCDGKPVVSEFVSEHDFTAPGSDLSSFPGKSKLASLLLRLRDATDGGMGSRSESPSFSGREPLHPDLVSFAYPSDMNSSLEKPLSNSSPVNRKALRDLLFRFSREITTRDVVDVQIISFSHAIPVYDIETSTSLYIGNGLVSSNCRCDVGYRVIRR